MAFLKKDTEVIAVTAPLAQHEHDNKHGVKLEDEVRALGLPQSSTEAFAEAVKFRDVIGGGIRTQA